MAGSIPPRRLTGREARPTALIRPTGLAKPTPLTRPTALAPIVTAGSMAWEMVTTAMTTRNNSSTADA